MDSSNPSREGQSIEGNNNTDDKTQGKTTAVGLGASTAVGLHFPWGAGLLRLNLKSS